MTLYIDSVNFSTATTVYLDSLLSNVAPDGYYSSQGYYRRQVGGKLTSIAMCPSIDTVSVTRNETTGVTFNGNLISNGGDVTAVRGFVYGTSPSPTTANSVVTDTVRSQGTYSLNATILSPEVTNYVRAYSIVFGQTIYGDQLSFTSSYCVNWTAANEGNIKMSSVGYIDFSAILAGRTIAPGPVSVGTITGFTIAGMTPFVLSTPISMTFTASKAQWNTVALTPVVTDKVLTSLTYSVEVTCTNGDDLPAISETTNTNVIAGQLTSSFNNCI
jgi:hypothetical protein